ncbi:MAG TPA: heme-binding domain-containing protein [Chitinophagaceae bacterium]|jgi:hypothetical protein
MRRFLVVLLIVLIVIQFIRPAKNISNNLFAADVTRVYNMPQNVSAILKKACTDCHSNNTIYPWYAQMQPIGWWLNNHIKEGKRELNLSEFGTYTIARQYKKLDDMAEQVNKGKMPISSYTLIHTNARLTDEEKDALINWCDNIRGIIKLKYPADSLKIKRRNTE